MNLDSEQTELERAAASTKKRISGDHDQARAQLQPLFLWLLSHLFDPELTVSGWLSACGVRDKLTSTHFRLQYGVSLLEYLCLCRLDTALSLLQTTNLSPDRIGELIGFASSSSFINSFDRHVGLHPKRFREVIQKIGKDKASLVTDFRRLQALLAGRKPDLLPLVIESTSDARDFSKGTSGIAEAVWANISALPPLAQRKLVRLQVVPQPLFFRLLLQKARVAGRRNLQHRVALAELALDSITALSSPSNISDYRTEAWAWIATARRLAFDLKGAWHALKCGDQEWNTPRQEKDRNAYADLLQARADYFCFRREFLSAKVAIDETIEIYEGSTSTKLAQALLVRGTLLAQAPGLGSPTTDFAKAYELVVGRGQEYLECVIVNNMARFCVLTGDHAGAQILLPLLESSVTKNLLGTSLEYQCEWIRGLSLFAAGDHASALAAIKTAHRGLVKLKELEHVAMISLDAAIIYLDAGENCEAIALVEDALQIFSALSLDMEDFASLIIVEEGLSKKALFTARKALVKAILENHASTKLVSS